MLFDEIVGGAYAADENPSLFRMDGTEDAVAGLENEETGEGSAVDEVFGEDVGTETDSSGEEVVSQSEELNTELVDVQEDAAEVEQIEAETEEAEEAAVATENFLANLLAAKALGSFTPVHAELAREHISYVGSRMGVPGHALPAIDFSRESFATAEGVAMNTEAAIDSVKDFFIKLIDAVMRGIAWILDKGRALIARLFGNFEKLADYAKKVKEAVSKISGDVDADDKKYKNASHVNALKVDGKKVKLSEAANIILNVAKNIASKWDTRAMGTAANKLTAAALQSVEDAEKNTDATLNNSDPMKGYNGSKESSAGLKDRVGALMAEHFKTISANAQGFCKPTTSQFVQRCGITLRSKETAMVSEILPRDKVIVYVTGNDTAAKEAESRENQKVDKFESQRTFIKVANYKSINKSTDIELEIASKTELMSTVTAITNTVQLMQRVKALIEAANPIVSQMKSIMMKMRTKYLALSKKTQNGKGIMANIRNTRRAVAAVKSSINSLREPGTSFATYCMFELKSLLDIVKYQAGQYESAD